MTLDSRPLDLSTLYNYVLQLGFSDIRNNQGEISVISRAEGRG